MLADPGQIRGSHFERMQLDRLGRGEALGKIVKAIGIHQETDTAAVHAKDRHALRSEAVQGFKH